MPSRRATELLIGALFRLPTIVTLVGIAIAFWLVATQGLVTWTALAIALIPLTAGCAVSLNVLLEERLARDIREQSGRAPEQVTAGAYSPSVWLLLIGASYALFSLGSICIAPALMAGLLCAWSGGTHTMGRCFGQWTNTTAWVLFGVGAVSFALCFTVFDPKKLDVDRMFRLRRNAERRQARRRNREELDAVADLYADLNNERKPDRPAQ